MLYRRALRPLLFARARDPEVIHEEVLRVLGAVSRARALTRALAWATGNGGTSPTMLRREVFGLTFPNPVGLAAGFDKNGLAAPALAALGFGFIEVGTVTHHAQPGNPRPRLFRLPEDGALINRMGFNNAGAAALAERLRRMPRAGVPLGISLGKSKVVPLDAAVEDYLAALDLLEPHGDYFAINVSSPNTPGLRALQERDRLDALLAALLARLGALAAVAGRARPRPLLLKVAPDLEAAALEDVVAVCVARGVDGLIATNTTLARDGLTDLRDEAGGLSGRPLLARALAVVARLHALAGERLPIVGCGGIAAADDARRFFDAGAVLVQLYTSFIYEGPGIARRITRELARG
jgi:dihydroorotate dehydrogenase